MVLTRYIVSIRGPRTALDVFSREERVKGSRATIIHTCAMHRSGIGEWGCQRIVGQTWYGIFEQALQAITLATRICWWFKVRVRRHRSGGNEKA